MSFEKRVVALEKKISALVEEVKGEIDDLMQAEIEAPDWEKVQKKDVLYKSYKEVVDLNYRISKQLTHLNNTIIAIKDLRMSLSKELDRGASLSYLKPTKNLLNKHLDVLKDYQVSLMNFKNAFDNYLRFYNSVQYILASPRLYGME